MIAAETRDLEGDAYLAAGLSPGDGQEKEGSEDLVVKRLLRLWMNERGAPVVLPFQFDAIQDIMELINVQVAVRSAAINCLLILLD